MGDAAPIRVPAARPTIKIRSTQSARNANFEFASSQRHDANQRRTTDSGVELDAWYVRPDRVGSCADGKRKRPNTSSAPGNAPLDADLAGCAAEGEEEEFRISRGGRRVGASASLDPPENGVATFGETNLGKCNILHIRHRLSGAQESLPFARHTP